MPSRTSERSFVLCVPCCLLASCSIGDRAPSQSTTTCLTAEARGLVAIDYYSSTFRRRVLQTAQRAGDGRWLAALCEEGDEERSWGTHLPPHDAMHDVPPNGNIENVPRECDGLARRLAIKRVDAHLLVDLQEWVKRAERRRQRAARASAKLINTPETAVGTRKRASGLRS